MLTKAKIAEQLQNLPEEFTAEQFFEHLIFIDKIDRGNVQSENGEVVSEQELQAEITAWFK